MARKSRKYLTQDIDLKYNVGIYARLSICNKSESIENQIKIVKEYLKNKKDCVITKTYVDKGISGGTFYRNAIKELEEDIETHFINCVAVKDLSRLGRNFIETSYYIEKFLPNKKIRFISVNDYYDSLLNEEINIALPLKNMINEFYLKDISLKISSALKAKNEYLGAVPYGYDKALSGKLIPNKNAKTVQKIYLMKSQGKSCAYIADELNKLGEKPPSALKYNNEIYKKSLWTSRSIKYILENEVYKGIIIKNKTMSIYKPNQLGKLKKIRIKRNKEDLIKIENAHSPIIL